MHCAWESCLRSRFSTYPGSPSFIKEGGWQNIRVARPPVSHLKKHILWLRLNRFIVGHQSEYVCTAISWPQITKFRSRTGHPSIWIEESRPPSTIAPHWTRSSLSSLRNPFTSPVKSKEADPQKGWFVDKRMNASNTITPRGNTDDDHMCRSDCYFATKPVSEIKRTQLVKF